GEVAAIYEELGYRIQRNSQQLGQEVDILAEREVPGGVSIRLIVEVKAKEKGPTNQEVIDFAAYITVMRTKGITGGVIVTETPAGKVALEVAESHGIRVLTGDQLRRSMIDFGPYL